MVSFLLFFLPPTFGKEGVFLAFGVNRRREEEKELTFGSKQLFLRRRLVVDAIEGEGELLGAILGIRNLDNGGMLALLGAVGTNNNVLVELLLQEWTYPGDDSNRHVFEKIKLKLPMPMKMPRKERISENNKAKRKTETETLTSIGCFTANALLSPCRKETQVCAVVLSVPK